MEQIKPKHYNLTITNRKTNESVICDYFDVIEALELTPAQAIAFRYFRKKGDIDKQINDTEKAIECLKVHKQQLIIRQKNNLKNN